MPDDDVLDADVLAATIEHFNANHADTVLFVACHAGDAAPALVPTEQLIDAEVVGVAADGVDLEVRSESGRDGEQAVALMRIPFDTPIDSQDQLQAAVFGLIARARQAVGESEPLTSIEREMATTSTLPTFSAEVLSIHDLTPNLCEIVVGGPGLAGFASAGGDQFVWIMVARHGAVPVPDDYSMADWMTADPNTGPHGAYYTVRSWDPDRAEMVLWAVLHDGQDDGGSRHDYQDDRHHGVGGWFARCSPGDRLALWGPREGFASQGAYAVNEPSSERSARHHLFVTDESGFCAVVVLLEELPTGDSATVVAETIDVDHEIAFPGTGTGTGNTTTVHWHHRGTEPPGTGPALYNLVQLALDGAVATTRTARPATAFGAAESRQMTQIRKHFRHELGMAASAVSMTGYWRR